LDDRIWHVIVVEFQPSSWSRGTYVNVAAMWLWNPKDYFSFDYGPYRVQGFGSADEAQWPERCRAAATVAADRVAKLRADLTDIGAAVRHLSSHPDAGWPTFDAAVASGLVGHVGRARALAKKVLREDDGVDWHREMKARVLEYSGLFDDPPEYRARIVAQRRSITLSIGAGVAEDRSDRMRTHRVGSSRSRATIVDAKRFPSAQPMPLASISWGISGASIGRVSLSRALCSDPKRPRGQVTPRGWAST
jgi:hypothetical protein